MIRRDSPNSRNYYLILSTFGAFQILFLFQIYYASLRQLPTQCDCQCTKQLHISAGGAELQRTGLRSFGSDSNVIHEQSDTKLYHGGISDELRMQQIIDAEDQALDREFHKNLSVLVEDDDPDYLDDKNSTRGEETKVEEKLMYREINLNPEINDTKSRCYGNHSDLILVYVYSAPPNFKERAIIRRTWGSVTKYKGKRWRVVFFLGELRNQLQKHYEKIRKESEKYGDLIQDLSYFDSYRNLTLKGLSALQWVSRYCPNTYRVVKADDDTLINPYQLVTFLNGQSERTMNNIICRVTSDVGPIRNPVSKYYVAPNEYEKDYYPDYCQGYGYIWPPSLLLKSLEKTKEMKLIPMEDVFFTGLTRKAVDAKNHALTAAFATSFTGFEIFLERITSRTHLILVGHVHDARSAEVFWKLTKQRFENGEKDDRSM